MTSAAYTLAPVSGIVCHGWSNPLILLDGVDEREFNQTDALAASGDYFVTLATRLDMLAQAMPRDSSEQIELENLVTSLFYLQKHYTVVAKHKLEP
jgi:hypothetical protein